MIEYVKIHVFAKNYNTQYLLLSEKLTSTFLHCTEFYIVCTISRKTDLDRHLYIDSFLRPPSTPKTKSFTRWAQSASACN